VHAQTPIHALGQIEERRHQITVELDDVQAGSSLEQRHGDRAATGPDFQQPFPGARRDRVDDGGDDAGRMQEMLSQPLLRPRRMSAQETFLSAAIMAWAVRRA
jgi:hypothetical protein